MRLFASIVIILICLTLNTAGAEQLSVYLNVNFDAKSAYVVRKFKETLPENDTNVTYTKVPRGLIVSVNSNKIFLLGSTELTPSGEKFLQLVGEVLNMFNNNCAIESHTDEKLLQDKGYKEEWEISIHRANVITAYLMKCCGVESERLYPIGYGDIMPFLGNVSKENFTDNRIDFVIFDYSARR